MRYQELRLRAMLVKTLLDGRMRQKSHVVNCAVSALAWLAMLTCIVILLTQPAKAA